MKLADKVAIITGGASGIGEAIVHRFAHEGAAVLIADLPDSAAQEVADDVTAAGGRAAHYLGDLSDEHHARACVRAAVEAFGRLDVLVSNAGVFIAMGDVDSWSTESFDYLTRMNTKPGFLMTKYALPELKKTRGNIVYTGSISGISGSGQLAVYGGSKGFVLAFMKGVAQEQAKNGIRANAVAPGAIATSWTKAGAGGPITPELEKMVAAVAPMGRLGTPEEMANVVAFLASDEASYVTGSVFVADGGVVPAQGTPGELVPAELKVLPPPKRPLRHTFDGEKGKPVQPAAQS